MRLDLWSVPGSGGSFVPFHGFSPVLKCLSVGWNDLPLQQVSDLIFSFPLLEDLHVSGFGRIIDGDAAIPQPSSLPKFTGTLVLEPVAADFVRRLSELPDGLCFRKIVWKKNVDNKFEGVADLVERCSDTLEYIDIECRTSVKSCRFVFCDS